MKKMIYTILISLLWLVACEDIYDPELEAMDELMVVDARLVSGNSLNEVRIYKTLKFYDPVRAHSPVNGATVTLIDQDNRQMIFKETERGRYSLMQPLNPSSRYKLQVKAAGDVYESDYEHVPKAASIDSAYTIHAEKLVETGTDESAGNLRKEPGSQVYIDIAAKEKGTRYRFTGKKIVQYVYEAVAPSGPPIPGTMYAWLTSSVSGLFNIAAPPEYSVSDDVRKHPLVFLDRTFSVFIPDTPTIFVGWIFICQQYAISGNAYNYYADLNSQLSAGGKLFDPVYTQARGNIKCITDPDKVILGNFEISTVTEHRFFVIWINQERYHIHRIPYAWNIPGEGKQFDLMPEWWEYRSKYSQN